MGGICTFNTIVQLLMIVYLIITFTVFERLYEKKDGFITVSMTSSRNGLQDTAKERDTTVLLNLD